jgi:dihydrofolate reductase
MVLLGIGSGMALNPVLLAATGDVEPEDAGLVSGVVNTSFMMGGALGLAVFASLAAARAESLLASGEDRLAALNGGYQAAFLVAAAFAVVAATVAAVLLRQAAAPGRGKRLQRSGGMPEPVGASKPFPVETRAVRISALPLCCLEDAPLPRANTTKADRRKEKNEIGSKSQTTINETQRSIGMGKIVATEYVSLDGVVEAPGGFEDFKHAGWSFEIDRGEEFERFKLDETLNSEALLLGRLTYEIFAASWPSMEGEVADTFNAMPKYVVTSTLENPEWNNSTVLKGDVVEEVSRLRQKLDGEIVVHGSPRLTQTLLEHDLVDELRMMVFPVVLGTGKRLFGETSDKKRLRLTDSRTVGDGIAILIYEPVRAKVGAPDARQ